MIGVGGDMNHGQNGSSLPSSAVRKNVPKSANPLKSFNWSKLPDCKVDFFVTRYLILSYKHFNFDISSE